MTTLDLIRQGPTSGTALCDFCLIGWSAENGIWYRFATPDFAWAFAGNPARGIAQWVACPDCARAAQQYSWHACAVAAADRWIARWGAGGWQRGELEHALGAMYGALNRHIRPPVPFVPGQAPVGATA